MFVSNDPTVNCPQALRWYGRIRRTTMHWEQSGGSSPESRTWKTESRSCPCEKLESGECGPRANLIFMIPEVSSGGLFQIDSSSINRYEKITTIIELRWRTGQQNNKERR